MRFNKMIPELNVSNLQQSLHFYVGVLGFKIEYRRPEQKFAFISYQGAQLMLEENPHSPWNTGRLARPFGRGVNFQIIVKNISPLLRRLKKNRQPLKIAPNEKWHRQEKRLLGERRFLVPDPDGYLLRFSQRIGTKKV